MFDTLKDKLEWAVAEGAYLGGGICMIDRQGHEQAFVCGAIHPPVRDGNAEALTDTGMRMRMASISKAATARAACALAVEGALDLEAEVADLLNWRDAPACLRSVTARMLLDHTSGLTDRAGYLFERPQSPVGFIAAHADTVASGRAPGSWFRYCNLNYVLLGSLLEKVSGQAFDDLLRDRVLGPAGISGGFNWAGVPAERRARRLPIYQRFGDRLERQTEPDAADWAADIVWGDGRGFSRAQYVPVRDPLLFSPHAGLRMNVIEAARLARFLGDGTPASRLQRQASWVFDPAKPNGNDCDGLYGAFGLGLMIYRMEPRIPGPLIGHAGHALGFTGGAWHNEATGVSFGLFLTGSADLTEGLENEVFYARPELEILRLL